MTVDLKAGLHMVTLGYIKKERYTGSGGGLRYYIQKIKPEGEEGEEMIEVCIWNEPYSFECTPDEEKHYRRFPLNEEGLSEALDHIMNVCKDEE